MYQHRADRSLESTLDWALDRMRKNGYEIRSEVSLSVDPKLSIMGYARKDGGKHTIVISEWALDSEMLGGLVLHELAHIYFTERGAVSHDTGLLEETMSEMRTNEGLRANESEYLMDAFNHLQNILVDDIVFTLLPDRELQMTTRFFSEWVSNRSSGDPVLDAALLCRNAFAIASLKRRSLFEDKGEMYYRNKAYVASLGDGAEEHFAWLEDFLEKSKSDWKEEEFREQLEGYFDRVLTVMRSFARFEDLK
ncbi:MAG TPA: DUF5781 family protein [Nitrososphaerales archaeon]|nr:DUF5781 family protein [Nitrososphaerales archaeon]